LILIFDVEGDLVNSVVESTKGTGTFCSSITKLALFSYPSIRFFPSRIVFLRQVVP